MEVSFWDYAVSSENKVFGVQCKHSPENLASVPKSGIIDREEDYFFFTAKHTWFYAGGHSSNNLFNVTLLVTRQSFFADPKSAINEVFEPSLYPLPDEVIESASKKVSSFLQGVVSKSVSRILCFEVELFEYRVEEYEEEVDEDLDRVVTRESGLEVQTVPASRDAIEGLEEVSDIHSLAIMVRIMAREKYCNSTCTVCMEKLVSPFLFGEDEDEDEDEDDRKVLRLPCQHLYHKKCIVSWLETNNICPLCRYTMPTSFS